MPKFLIKSVGPDIKKPKTFRWTISSGARDQLITRGGFKNEDDAKSDCNVALKTVLEDEFVGLR